MKIIISFATEDFVTPEHDDAILRLATLLSKKNIRGSFHLTGDFARKMREKQRTDVIEALKKHEIGYHSDTHGAFPFLAEICENNSWDDAVAQLMRTEAKGILDIQEIFDVRPQYYVIEFVKAPQLVYALRCLGVDVLGFSNVPGIESPFSWQTGSLCFSAPHMGVECPPCENRLENFKIEFDKFHEQARRGVADGVIKIFNHPYKFIYNNNVASWVSENRIYRDYDIHRKWNLPASSMYDKQTVDRLFDEFEALLDYALAKGDVQFMGTSELVDEYRDRSPKFIDIADVAKLADASLKELTYHKANDHFYTPAEIFAMTTYCLEEYRKNSALPKTVPYRRPIGPVEMIPEFKEAFSVPFAKLLEDMKIIEKEIDFYQRIPAKLKFNGSEAPLGSCFKAFANALTALGRNETPENISFENAPNLPKAAEHDYYKAEEFTRPLYPEGFTGKNICEHSRLQTWSYGAAGRHRKPR